MNPQDARRRHHPWYRRAAALFCLLSFGIALFAIGTWLLGDWRIGTPHETVPIAPSTALALAVLSGVLLVLHIEGERRRARLLLAVSAFLCALPALLFAVSAATGIPILWETPLLAITDTVQGFPVGRMSPITAGLLLAAALASGVLAAPGQRRAQGLVFAARALTLSGGGFSLLIALAYATDTPLFYNGRTIPVAYMTALSLASLNLAIALWLIGSARASREGAAAQLRLPWSDTAIGALGALVLLAVGVTASGLLYLRVQQRLLRETITEQLKAVAELKELQIGHWYSERLSDARFIETSPAVAQQLRHFFSLEAGTAPSAEKEARAQVLGWLAPMQGGKRYETIRVYDAEMRLRIALPEKEGQGQDDLNLAAVGRNLRQTTLVDLRHTSDEETIRFDLLVPVYGTGSAFTLSEGDAGAAPAEAVGVRSKDAVPLAVVQLRMDPSHYLYPVLQAWPTSSPSAEVLLVRREGDEVLFLNRLRHRQDAALKFRRSILDRNLPAVRGALGERGIVEGLDYRGMPVLASLRQVRDLPWILVAKVDLAEVFAPLHRQAIAGGGILAALLLSAALAASFLWRNETTRHLDRALVAEREIARVNRLYSTLSQINQAIVHIRSRQALFEEICRIAVRQGGFRMAWIGWQSDDGSGFRKIASFGEGELLLAEKIVWDDTGPSGGGPTAVSLQTGQTSVDNDIGISKASFGWAAEAHKHGFRSMIAMPIRFEGKVRGVFTVYSGDAGYFGEKEILLLEEAASDLSYALSILAGEAQRERAEEELRHLNQELELRVKRRTADLEAANRELEAFSYSVSHDLRTPLRAIDGFARILSSEHAGQLDDEGRRLLGVIVGESERMASLIDSLLNLSRLGRQALAQRPLDPGPLVREIFETMASREKKRRFDLGLSPLPIVHADPSLLRIALVNLIENAGKYSRGRDVSRIDVSGSIQGTDAVLRISDNGVGFNMKYSQRLFGVFQRLHRQDQFEGTGIGLALVHRIVQRHGGRIWAEGRVDEGATFWFTLPAACQHEPPPSGDRAPSTPHLQPPNPPPSTA